MQFGSYFKGAELPTPPLEMPPWDQIRKWPRNWGMLGNDRQGDCFWAGAAHETMALWSEAGAGVPMFTTNSVFKDYHAAMGPDDGGTDLQDGCAYRQKTGIADALGHRHTIDIYAALRPKDLKELDLAVYLFGIAGVGVELPDTAETQFIHAEPFSVVEGADVVGGHYIPVIGRNSRGDYLGVTWGRLTAIDPEWIQEYMDQGVAIVSRERLSRSGLSPQGFNLAQLEDDFRQLTGA